jgi:molecular chaperone HtpG
MTEQTIPFKAEVARLLDIVVHALYSNKEIFLRELISNAADACDKLRYQSLTQPELTGDDPDPTIRILLDPKGRTVTIRDNGIGMTQDELVENLGTIARSGTAEFLKTLSGDAKKDTSLIGQFGVGFYSAFMVAETVEVISRKAGSDEAFCWRSSGIGTFAVEEADKSSRGTDIILYLKPDEDEFLEEDRVRHIVHTYSDHIPVPIFLGDGAGERLNRPVTLWMRPRQDVTKDEYTEFYRHVSHAFDSPQHTIHWKAEGVIDYTALLFVPSFKPFDLFDPRRQHHVKLYVRRVFITDAAEGLLPGYLRFLRGVVDSEDLPLNVSREMLQHNPVLAKMRAGIVKRVLSDLVKLQDNDPDGYAQIWTNFGAVLKEGLYEDQENRDLLFKLCRFRTTTTDSPTTTLADYVARMKDGQDSIYYATGDDVDTLARSPQLEGFRARGIEVLLLADPIDEFWIPSIDAFEGKALKSVTRAGIDLDKFSPADAASSDAPKPDEDSVIPLLAAIKAALGDTVKDVRASHRLTESAVCLVAAEGDLDIRLERLLKQQKQYDGASKRILEINPAHPLILKLTERASAGGDLNDAAWILLDQARLLEGEPLPDPMAFVKRVTALMAA